MPNNNSYVSSGTTLNRYWHTLQSTPLVKTKSKTTSELLIISDPSTSRTVRSEASATYAMIPYTTETRIKLCIAPLSIIHVRTFSSTWTDTSSKRGQSTFHSDIDAISAYLPWSFDMSPGIVSTRQPLFSVTSAVSVGTSYKATVDLACAIEFIEIGTEQDSGYRLTSLTN